MEEYDFSSAPWNKYRTWIPEDIRAEHRDNKFIDLKAIEKASLELYRDEEDHMDMLCIRIHRDTFEFSLPWGNGLHAQSLLSQVLDLQVCREEESRMHVYCSLPYSP
jgi:hypothetical protein